MNRQNLARMATAAITCLSIVLCVYLFKPLQGAQQARLAKIRAAQAAHKALYEQKAGSAPATQQAATTTAASSTKTTSPAAKKPIPKARKPMVRKPAPKQPQPSAGPKAPAIAEEKTQPYMTKERATAIAVEKKKRTDAAAQKRAQVSQTEKTEEKKESKDEKKQAAATPFTRNLIMIFDNGNDTGAITDNLVTALRQQCAFIIINQQLWEHLKTAPAKTRFIDKNEPDSLKLTLEAALNTKSCTDIFFASSEWNVYMADGEDTNKKDRFYVFVPHHYINAELNNARDDKDLGLNISTLSLVKDPLKTTTTPTAAENNYYKGNVVANALQKILYPVTTHPWNIYCMGHGVRGDRNTGQLIGLSIPAFENLMQFFNKPLMRPTNLFFYDTCFGGGTLATAAFTTAGAPIRLTYPIIAGSATEAITRIQIVFLSTEKKNDYYALKLPMESLSKTIGLPINLFTSTDFDIFFKGLESFANGTSTNMDLIRTINAVDNFLTPDLKEVRFLENIPQIRWPGVATWFQVMRFAKELPITHLTHTRIMAKNYDTLRNNQPWEFNVTGKKIVLIQTHDIAVPLIINDQTKLVPLIHSIPFFQQKPLPIFNNNMTHLFAFTAPLIAQNGLFTTLSSLWFLPKDIHLFNVILVIDTLICGNDLTTEEQNALSDKKTLTLKQMMIFLNAENPVFPFKTNTVLFTYNNKPFLIDIDQPIDQLSQLDEQHAQQYQALYKQCFEHCIDKSIEPLRTANENKLTQKIIADAIKVIEDKAVQSKNMADQMLRAKKTTEKLAEIKKQLAAAKNDFLSSNLDKRDEAAVDLVTFLNDNTTFAFPIIIEAAAAGILSTKDKTRLLAFDLFKDLFEKRQGFSEALKAASAALQATEPYIQTDALNVFNELVAHDQYIPEALKAAISLLHTTSPKLQAATLQLFSTLIENGHPLPQTLQTEVLQTASSCIQSGNDNLFTNALFLFRAFFARGEGFKEAQNVIDQINHTTATPTLVLNNVKKLQDALNFALKKRATEQGAKVEQKAEEKNAKASITATQTKPQTNKPQPQKSESWVCPLCETENKAAEKVCIECKAPRPAAS